MQRGVIGPSFVRCVCRLGALCCKSVFEQVRGAVSFDQASHLAPAYCKVGLANAGCSICSPHCKKLTILSASFVAARLHFCRKLNRFDLIRRPRQPPKLRADAAAKAEDAAARSAAERAEALRRLRLAHDVEIRKAGRDILRLEREARRCQQPVCTSPSYCFLRPARLRGGADGRCFLYCVSLERFFF